jgi:hypothetical protein
VLLVGFVLRLVVVEAEVVPAGAAVHASVFDRRRQLMRRAALLVLLSAMLWAPPSAQAIIGGAPDGARHPYVGLLVTPEGFCSGSLISSTIFVTAGHCGSEGEQVGITVAEHPTSSTQLVAGTFHQLPGFCNACEPGLPGFAVPDLAVVTLDSPITVGRYASLPTVNQSATLLKQSVTDVGYGVNGFSHGGGPPVEIFNEARYFASLTLIPAQDTISDTYLKLSANTKSGAICFGDSGGPVLAGDTILGVNSIVNGMCTASAYAYRVDTAASLAFIQQFL